MPSVIFLVFVLACFVCIYIYPFYLLQQTKYPSSSQIYYFLISCLVEREREGEVVIILYYMQVQMAAMKAFHVPNEAASLSFYPPLPNGGTRNGDYHNKFMVIGHRGSGMNLLASTDNRMKAIKENSILSFNSAARSSLDFIEFDVQVTEDGCPIIFHDDVILSEESGTIYERRVTELSLSEFLSYGPQREPGKVGKSLLRKTKEGKILKWDVERDDFLCTLEETFQKVDSSLGFNIELKFDDHIVYSQEHLIHALEVVLKIVFEHGKDRPIIFSSFQPDAALLMRKLQSTHPVFFLTNGGNEIYYDVRRNSLEEALKLCLEGGLEGVVSEVRGIFRNPEALPKFKEAKLSLLTYGKLNNVPEAVYLQHLMGVEGVIVDLVEEIAEAVSMMIKPLKVKEETEKKVGQEDEMMIQQLTRGDEVKANPQFSQRELSFLLKLIPELIQL